MLLCTINRLRDAEDLNPPSFCLRIPILLRTALHGNAAIGSDTCPS